MTKLQNQLEYDVTREKLSELQRLRDQAQERPSGNPYVKQLTLRSLNRLIKQLREEMIWYECHAGVREPSSPGVATVSNAETGGTSSPCTN